MEWESERWLAVEVGIIVFSDDPGYRLLLLRDCFKDLKEYLESSSPEECLLRLEKISEELQKCSSWYYTQYRD